MTTPDSGHLTIAPPSLMSANGPRQDLMRRQGSLSTRTAVGMMEKSKTEDFVVFFRSNHQLWTCTDLCIIFALSTECTCVVSECNNSNKSLKNKIKRSISCPSWPWVWLKSNPANLPDTNELYVFCVSPVKNVRMSTGQKTFFSLAYCWSGFCLGGMLEVLHRWADCHPIWCLSPHWEKEPDQSP